MVFSLAGLSHIFATDAATNTPLSEDQRRLIGAPRLLEGRGRRRQKGFSGDAAMALSAARGYIAKPKKPMIIATFVTKGGVLKTSLSLNLARMAALHGIKTCVVGLDLQCDITTSLGFSPWTDTQDFAESLEQQQNTLGLYDAFEGRVPLAELLQSTDLSTLFLIPETPELVVLEKALFQKARRETWLNEVVLAPLRRQFDLIVLDCSPNWNLLTTNALVACDLLLSPLECKINNYRNFKMFDAFIRQFREEMRLQFAQAFVPTRLNPQRKLSREILAWYLENVNGVVPVALRESTAGEEAIASNMSTPEYAPGTFAAIEINQILEQVFHRLEPASQAATRPLPVTVPVPVTSPLPLEVL